MFKNYLQLNEKEKERFFDFINRKGSKQLPPEDMDKQFKALEYDFGRGILIKFHNEVIIGRISVILKECSERGIAYIINLDIDNSIEEKAPVIKELLEEAKKTAAAYGVEQIFLGTKNNEVVRVLNSAGINKAYSAVKMKLEDRKLRYEPLSPIPLSEGNRKEYLNIYNQSLKETINGASLTEDEIDEYIRDSGENNYYFIAENDNVAIGILQFNLEGGAGQFDLGLIKAVRGRGYGKRLLETAISFLNSKEVNEINLTVITKNTLACEMYKKRGFIESSLISEWFKL